MVSRVLAALLLASTAVAYPEQADPPVRVGGHVAEPRKIKNTKPIYPDAAKRAGIQDVVFIDCRIDAKGNVADLSILRGDPILAAAAEKAVRKWKYAPTLLNGVAVPVVMTVTVNYHFSGASPTWAFIRALQDDPQPQVRRLAASSLWSWCPRSANACRALREARGDDDEEVREAAREALKRAGIK